MKHPFSDFKHAVAAVICIIGFSLPLSAETLDEMFDSLQSAEPEEGVRIEQRIARAWQNTGSAALDLLVQRGSEALDAQHYDAAIEHFTAALDTDPMVTEALYGRATAYFSTGYTGPALADLEALLATEPRHFFGIFLLGTILEEAGREAPALAAYRAVLDLHPTAEAALAAVERLEARLEGAAI